MTPENFCYWLQGLFELSGTDELSPEQVQMIKDHLQLVFKKETPDLRSIEDFIKTKPKPEEMPSGTWQRPHTLYPQYWLQDHPDLDQYRVTC